MAINNIDTGIVANDGTGDPIRRAFQTVNENFDYINGGLFAGREAAIISAASIETEYLTSNTYVSADTLVATSNLYATQGGTIVGNLSIIGNLIVSGTQTTTQSQQSTSAILELQYSEVPLITNNLKDIGIQWQYYDTEEKRGFLGRQNTTGTLIYQDAITNTGDIITAGSFGNVQFGSLTLSNTTPSTSNVTGALTVAGGVGIQGNVYAQGNLVVGDDATVGNLTIRGYHVGSLNFSGSDTIYINGSPVQTAAASFNGGTVGLDSIFDSGTPSTSTTSGALRVNGGLGVTGNVWASNIFTPSGGNVVANVRGTVYTASQPFITSVGDLSSLNVNGRINSGNIGPLSNLTFSLGTASNNRWLNIWAFDMNLSGTLTGGTVNSTGGTHSGSTVFNVNSSTNAVRITQTGTGNALLVEDSTSPDSTPFVVASDGKVLIGVATPVDATAKLEVTGSNLSMNTYANDTSSHDFRFRKSRSSSPGTFSSITNGDSTGAINWFGDDGTQFVNSARIDSAIDGTVGTNSMPGRIVISTTPSGSSSPTERLRISSFGGWGLGGANYGENGLQAIVSNGNASPPTWQTVVTPSATQTLTNKTINFADNTINGVQASLVSGTNIKTVNGNSLLGSGDITIAGGVAGPISSTNNALAVFDGTAGSTIKNSTLIFNPANGVLTASGFAGSGAALTSLDPTNLASAVPISKGGTGLTTVGANGQVLTSDGTGMIWSTPAAGGGGVTSITGTASQITASASTGAVTLSLPASITISGTMSAGTFSGSGSGLTSLNPSNLSSSVPVSKGGTGLNSVGSSGQVLTSNGSSIVWATPTASGGTVTAITAGAGMNFTQITSTGSVTMGTPSTLTTSTTNSVSGTTHTHAVTFPVSSVDGATGAISLAALSSFAKSSASAGYQKLPGGITFQWGYKGATGGSTAATFPISFTTLYSVTATPTATSGDTGGITSSVAITAQSTTGFTVSLGTGDTTGFFWIAIGTS